MTDINEGACPESEDGQHCSCWWDCVPCCHCGHDEGGDNDCDCPRHAQVRESA